MSILVCVTGQKSCERLIVTGAGLAARENEPLIVLHVARKGNNVLGYANEPQALEYLLGISVAHGADMRMHKSDEVLDTIEQEAKACGASTIVAGRAANYSGWDMLDELKARLPGVNFEILGS